MDPPSTTNRNPPKRRGRKRRRTPEAPCQDCIRRATESSGRGDVSFCDNCARTLGHARRSGPQLPVQLQTTHGNSRVKKPDYRRRAATNSISAALRSTQSELLTSPAVRAVKEKLAELPSVFESLKQAMDMLRPVEDRLSSLILSVESEHHATVEPSKQDSYRHRCMPWLTTWERAFTSYLLRNKTNMTIDEYKAAMTLKAHHLIAEIFAAVQLTESQFEWSTFNKQFMAVLNLAAEVVKEAPDTTYSASTNRLDQFQGALPEISILDPVFEVRIRATDQTLQGRAKQLLTTIDPTHFRLNMEQILQGDLRTLPPFDAPLTTTSNPILSHTSPTASSVP